MQKDEIEKELAKMITTEDIKNFLLVDCIDDFVMGWHVPIQMDYELNAFQLYDWRDLPILSCPHSSPRLSCTRFILPVYGTNVRT